MVKVVVPTATTLWVIVRCVAMGPLSILITIVSLDVLKRESPALSTTPIPTKSLFPGESVKLQGPDREGPSNV